MNPHQGRTVGATVGIVGCDFVALLADLNLGAIATGISMIGGSAVGVMYLWITKRAEAKALAHERWVKAHSNEIEREQARLRQELADATIEREKLAAQVADLTHRIDEKDRTLVEFQGESDNLRVEMEELLRQQMIKEGVIVKTTTKLMVPSSDQIPVSQHPEPPLDPEPPPESPP